MDEETSQLITERRIVNLSQEQIKQIAAEAAKIAVEQMQANLYQEIGKTFLSKLFQLIGIIIVGLTIWLNNKGILKLF